MMCYPRPGSLQKVSQSVCCYIHNTTLFLKAPSKTNPRVHHWRAGEQTSRVPGAKHHRTTGRNKGLTGLLQGQPSGTMCLVEEVRRMRCMVSFTDGASKAHFADRQKAGQRSPEAGGGSEDQPQTHGEFSWERQCRRLDGGDGCAAPYTRCDYVSESFASNGECYGI